MVPDQPNIIQVCMLAVSSETLIIVPNEYANYTLNSQIPGRPHHNLISFPPTNIKPSKDVFMTMLWSIIKPLQKKHQAHI